MLYTKLRGKAMTDFETRDVRTFQLRDLETVIWKRSTTQLQIEFNSLKQKSGESARAYGIRVDNLAMELYESNYTMIESQGHTSDQKRVILDTIQKQTLQNFQIGLHEEIKLFSTLTTLCHITRSYSRSKRWGKSQRTDSSSKKSGANLPSRKPQ